MTRYLIQHLAKADSYFVGTHFQLNCRPEISFILSINTQKQIQKKNKTCNKLMQQYQQISLHSYLHIQTAVALTFKLN